MIIVLLQLSHSPGVEGSQTYCASPGVEGLQTYCASHNFMC